MATAQLLDTTVCAHSAVMRTYVNGLCSVAFICTPTVKHCRGVLKLLGDQSHPRIHKLPQVWVLGCMLSSSAFTRKQMLHPYTKLSFQAAYGMKSAGNFRSTDKLILLRFYVLRGRKHIQTCMTLSDFSGRTWLLPDQLKLESIKQNWNILNK